mmetsp:Transcript_14244/g.38201  ORF Transcript_14244/g.38201 Transcript_14244/m.38201 type:complete len:206 (-) Transcript_14244:1515-2132(-)
MPRATKRRQKKKRNRCKQARTFVPGVCLRRISPTITRALEVEPQVKHSAIKRATKATLVRVLPRPLHNFEREILVRSACHETEDARVRMVRRLKPKGRSLCAVDEIRVVHVELVALDRFRRRVVLVVMRLIVLIPVVPNVCAIEISRFSRSVQRAPRIRALHFANLHIEFFFACIQPFRALLRDERKLVSMRKILCLRLGACILM